MLIDINCYSQSLKKLWSTVFGDSDEYISLILDKGYKPPEVFGEIVDGEVVSALYLLGCNIKSDGKIYRGRYLYAAATLPEYRKAGMMSRLINEAERYIEENNIDFIALVPAEDSLYGYYSKFGFEPMMYKYVSVVPDSKYSYPEDEIISDAEAVLNFRNLFTSSKLSFEISDMKYALSCLEFAGYHTYRNSEDSYYISDKNKSEIIEFISSEENLIENIKTFLTKIKSGAEVSSPYDLSMFCESKKQVFGMIFTENVALKSVICDGIYMNVALD